MLARWALPVAMFVGSFAWSFVQVSLPFYIQDLSRFDAATTLRWTGFILGISPLITVITAPISGWLAGSRDPKRAFVWTQGLQAAGFVLMAFARSLGEIFFARCLLGAMGAVSTFAFIMAGRSGGDVRREVSEIQLGMTLGQVLGPAAGALTAARLGFRLSFLLSSVMLGLVAWLVAWGVPAGRGRAASSQARAGTASLREIATVCVLVLGCLTQVFFLTAILPQVLPRLGVPARSMLEVGGLVLLADGLAMALGTMAAPRRGRGLRRPAPGAVAARVLVALSGRALAGDERRDLRRHPLRAGAVHRAGLPARRRGDRAPRLGRGHRLPELGADRRLVRGPGLCDHAAGLVSAELGGAQPGRRRASPGAGGGLRAERPASRGIAP